MAGLVSTVRINVCNCKDSDEVCDNVDGRCQSGCQPNYAGDSCHIGKLRNDSVTMG